MKVLLPCFKDEEPKTEKDEVLAQSLAVSHMYGMLKAGWVEHRRKCALSSS